MRSLKKNKFQTGGAVSTECPEATLNPQLSATNEQRAIADTEYNVTGGTPESACGNCASFDVSQRMKQCMQDGGETVGYCWANQFKCDAAAICNKWKEGGPVTDDQASYDIGARYTEESQPAMPELQTAQYGGAVRLPRAATGYESDWSGKDASFRGFVDDRQYTPFLHTPRPQSIPRMAGTKFGDGLGVLAAAADMFRNTGRRNRAPESDPGDYQRHKYSSREGVNLADYTMHPGEKYTPIKKDALRDMYEQYSYGTIGTDSRGMGTLDFNPRYEADPNRPATGTYGFDELRDLENNSDLFEKIKPILQGNPYYTINGQPTGVPLYRTASAKTTDNMSAARRYGGSLPQAQTGNGEYKFQWGETSPTELTAPMANVSGFDHSLKSTHPLSNFPKSEIEKSSGYKALIAGDKLDPTSSNYAPASGAAEALYGLNDPIFNALLFGAPASLGLGAKSSSALVRGLGKGFDWVNPLAGFRGAGAAKSQFIPYNPADKKFPYTRSMGQFRNPTPTTFRPQGVDREDLLYNATDFSRFSDELSFGFRDPRLFNARLAFPVHSPGMSAGTKEAALNAMHRQKDVVPGHMGLVGNRRARIQSETDFRPGWGKDFVDVNPFMVRDLTAKHPPKYSVNQQGGELPKAQNGLGTVLDWPRQTPGVVAVDEAGAYSKKLPAVTVEAENPWGPYYNTLTEDQKQWLRNHPNDDDATTRSIKAQASQGYGIDGNPTFGESVEDAANRTLYGLGHLAGEIGLVKPIYRTLERTYEDPELLKEHIINTGITLAQMSNPYGIANEFYQGAKSYLDESAEPYYPFISGKNIAGEDKWSGLAATADASAIVPFAGPLIRTGKAVSKPVVGALKQLRTPSLSDFLPSTGYTPPPVVSSLFPKPVSYAVPPGKGGAPRTNITPEHDQLERLLKETERIKMRDPDLTKGYNIVYGGPTGRQLANPALPKDMAINLPQQRLPEQIPFDIENYYHMMSQRGGKGNMDHLRKLVKIRESGMKMDKFFSNLDWTSDGKTLWNKLGSLNATVLTGGKELGASANAISTGKRGWVKKNLNLTGDKVIIEKQKELYASPSKILIDDTPSVVDKFRAAGGNAILHTSSRSTVRQLNKMLKENPNLKDGIYTDLDGVLVDLKGGVEKYGQAVPPGKGWGSGMISPTETLPAHLNESLATKIDVPPNYKNYLKLIRGVGKESTLGRLTTSDNVWYGKPIGDLERGIKYLNTLETNPRYEGAMKMVTPDEAEMLFGKGGIVRTINDKGKEVLEIPLKKELQELHKKFTIAKGKPGEKDYVPPSVQDGIIGGKNAKPLEGVSESDHIALAESYHQDIGSGRPSGSNIDLKQMYDGLLAGFKDNPSLMGKDSGRQMAIDNGLVKEYEAAREEASKWLVKTGKKTQKEIDEILGQGRSMGREVTDKQFPDIVDLGSTEGFISTTPLKGPYKELISEVNYKQGIPAAAQYKAAWLEYANPKNIGKEFMPASNLSTDSYVTSIKALTKAVEEGKFSYDKAGRPKIQVHGYNPYNDAGFTTGVDPNILKFDTNNAIADLNAVIATKTKEGVTPEKVPFIATDGLPAKAYAEAAVKKDLEPVVQARIEELNDVGQTGEAGLENYMKYTGKSRKEVVEAFEKMIEKEKGITIDRLREKAEEIFKHVGGDAHPVISITRKEGGSLPIAQNGNGFYDAFEDWLGDYEVPDHEITWGDFDEVEEFPDESWEPGMGGVDWGRPTSDIAPDVTMESDYGKGFFEPMGDRSKFRKDYRKEKNINNPDLTGKQRRGIRGDARDAAWEENPNMFGAAPFNKMNEFFNKKGVKQVTGTLSDATVLGGALAGFLGQRNQNKKYYDWEEHGTDTASIYGTEPGGQPLQRGTFNVNSGTFVDDSKVAETRWVGYGGETTPYSKPYPRYAEQGGEIVDVDEATLRKLIAAGAGLEIL
tara:strand:- start:66682 stop:72453 length:5772 start_codon:yes stop_codon:yes gene_type:complete